MAEERRGPAWIPRPRTVEEAAGAPLVLSTRSRIAAADKELGVLAGILSDEIFLATGLRLAPCRGDAAEGGICLRLDPDAPKGYSLRVGDGAVVVGRDYPSVASGTVTLLQGLSGGKHGVWLPRMSVADAPGADYRAVMIDCARHPQSIPTLRQVVQMCRFYKIRYLHLHLTDDEAFTFPSRKYPTIATPGRCHTWEQLEELERFAAARGVAIVPELDVPGHSEALVRALPELFGPKDGQAGGSLVHLGREAVFAALDDIVGEMCEVFRSGPYFHIGGDEVGLAGIENDPEARAYMEERGLSGGEELYRHFLVRMHEIVSKHGKQTVAWEGFRRGGRVAIPKDLIVVAWDTRYQRPDELLRDGYAVVNASWQPLYVVGGGRGPEASRMWSQKHLHGWNMYRWEHYQEEAPSFGGLEVPRTARVLGAQLCVWEHLESSTVPDLRERVPAMAERVWNPEAGGSYADFRARYERADVRLARILR